MTASGSARLSMAWLAALAALLLALPSAGDPSEFWTVGLAADGTYAIAGEPESYPPHRARLAVIARAGDSPTLAGHGEYRHRAAGGQLKLAIDGNLESAPEGLSLRPWSAQDGRWPNRPLSTRPIAPRPTNRYAVNGVEFELVTIPAGTARIGAEHNEHLDMKHWETPVRRQSVDRDFEIGKTEVTQGLWTAVMGTNAILENDRVDGGRNGLPCSEPDDVGPGKDPFIDDDAPISCISWLEAVRFCNTLSAKAGLAPAYTIRPSADADRIPLVERVEGADSFRLPTNLEWEYAARAQRTRLYAGSDRIDNVGWDRNNSRSEAQPVCQKWPNRWGLCDMSGNAWEWVWDVFPLDLFQPADTDRARKAGSRTGRGGGWALQPHYTRPAASYGFPAVDRYLGMGFRIAKSIQPEPRVAEPD